MFLWTTGGSLLPLGTSRFGHPWSVLALYTRAKQSTFTTVDTSITKLKSRLVTSSMCSRGQSQVLFPMLFNHTYWSLAYWYLAFSCTSYEIHSRLIYTNSTLYFIHSKFAHKDFMTLHTTSHYPVGIHKSPLLLLGCLIVQGLRPLKSSV